MLCHFLASPELSRQFPDSVEVEMGYPPFVTWGWCRCSQPSKPAFHNSFSPLIILLLQSAVVLNPPKNHGIRGYLKRLPAQRHSPRSSVGSQSILDYTLSPHRILQENRINAILFRTMKQLPCGRWILFGLQFTRSLSPWTQGIMMLMSHLAGDYQVVNQGATSASPATLLSTLSLDFQMFGGTSCQKHFYPRVLTLSPSPRLNNFS